MSLLGNLIWLILGGLISAIGWFLGGIIFCITVIGIPFGIQCFKISSLTLTPFGKDVEIGNFGAGGLIANIIWIILFGWELCLGHIVFGLILAVTIVGIPFAKQHFKLAKLAILPFGADIR
ncbi:YccF domain-containing protein [Abyssisolibacter fermentans]|uniref:YccF domain-containing protein n=1 Tax=Abyssisolibacter fermentans TaxID=1766203 RepID=UPI000832756D|nr:YccF domain-containing protein [Abyssisolibacter fermentans]